MNRWEEVDMTVPLHKVMTLDPTGQWVRYDDHLTALAADRARIAAAVRKEMNFPSGIPDPASQILDRLLRVVEGG